MEKTEEMHPLFQKADGHTGQIIGDAAEVRKDDEPLRFDGLVETCVLVAPKMVETMLPIHKAQRLSYLKLLDVPVGALINFIVPKPIDGVSSRILPGANH